MSVKFSFDLDASIERATAFATERRHEFVTLEHLLLGLLPDSSVRDLIETSRASYAGIEASVREYIANEMSSLEIPANKFKAARPTKIFHRVLERAVKQVDEFAGTVLYGDDVLLSLMIEHDSPAVYFLNDQGLTQKEVLRIIEVHARRARSDRPSSSFVVAADEAQIESIAVTESLRLRAEQAETELQNALSMIADLEAKIQTLSAVSAAARADHPDIFICYARTDAAWVEKLVNQLRLDRFVVWWDADIPAGAPWEATIERYIGSSKVVLACWSNRSVKSENVKAEARFARDRQKLVQIFLDDAAPPMFFGERQGLGFSEWDGSTSARPYQDLVLAARKKLLESSVTN